MSLRAELIFENINKDEDLQLFKKHKTDSGFDLRAPYNFEILPDERVVIDTGIRFKIKIPLIFKILNLFGAGIGMELQHRGRSGLAVKDGLEAFFGTVDEDYRGEFKSLLINNGKKTIFFKKGDRMCQIVPVVVFNRIRLKEGVVDELTTRGSGGFGSTGRQ